MGERDEPQTERREGEALPETPPPTETLRPADRDVRSVDQGMIGKRIGRYTIKGVIGSGGMGTVFQAVQEQPRRRVAIKMLKQGVSSRSAQRRFEFESQLLARLKHPGIAQVYEAGTFDDGHGDRPYFVMEYIVGAKTLTEYAEAKKLGTRSRLELFVAVCDAVQHGHLKGIVHRDLKPGNILVGSGGRPRIIDFGVARSTDSDMAITTLQTDVGQLVGTLQYMSPEQIEADPTDLDARSDVYALGVILYELLTGRLPYDVSKVAIHEAARIVKEEPPTRLSTIDRQLRGDVETITMKAMEKIRNHRYQSASELQQDIQNYLDDQPILASPPTAIANLRRFARRHRAATVALASIFSVLIVAVIGITIFAVDADAQRAAAEQSRARAESVSGFVSTMLSSRDPVTMGTIDKALMTPVLAQASESLARQFTEEPLVKADLHGVIGRAYRNLGMYADSRNHLSAALDIQTTLRGPDHPERIDALMDMARQFTSERRGSEARPLYEEVLAARHRSLGPDHPDTIDAMMSLGTCLSALDDFEESHRLLEAVVQHRTDTLGEDHLDTLTAVSAYATLLLNESRYEEAEQVSRDLVQRYRNRLGNADARTLREINHHAKLLGILGRRPESKVLLEETVKGRRIVLGPDHPFTLRTVNDLADLLVFEQNFPRAEALYREALDGRRRVVGNDHVDTLWSLTYLGRMLEMDDRPREAEPYLREALEGWERVGGPQHLRTREATMAYGRILQKLDQHDAAIKLFEKALAIESGRSPRDESIIKHLRDRLAAAVLAKQAWRDLQDRKSFTPQETLGPAARVGPDAG